MCPGLAIMPLLMASFSPQEPAASAREWELRRRTAIDQLAGRLPLPEVAQRAQRRSGALLDQDAPSNIHGPLEGSVRARLLVGEDGRVNHCEARVLTGSGTIGPHTCLIIQRRFRYHPALDRAGRAIPSVESLTVRWLIAEDAPPRASFSIGPPD